MKQDVILFSKMNDSVIIPTKRVEDAGYDIYANFKEDFMIIKPQETVLIPTGLVSAFDSKWVAILKERGSTGTKGMAQRCGVIDSGYRGEWLVPITNTTKETIFIAKNYCVDSIRDTFGDVTIYPYEKAISQMIMVEVPRLEVMEVDMETVNLMESERGTGKLGSSNK